MMHDCEVTALCISNDSQFLLSADVSKKVNLFRIDRGTIIKTIETGHHGSIGCMLFSTKEDQIFTASSDIKVEIDLTQIWGLKSGRKLNEIQGHDQAITSMRHFEEYLMTSSLDGQLRVLNYKTGHQKMSFKPYGSSTHDTLGVVGFEYLPHEQVLTASSGRQYSIVSFDGQIVAKGEVSCLIIQIEEQDAEIQSVAISPNNTFSYFASRQGYLYCFNIKSNKMETFSKTTNSKLLCMVHHPMKNLIALLTDSSELLFLEP